MVNPLEDMPKEQIIEHLKKVYGVDSSEGVIRRALEIALAASRYADDDRGGEPNIIAKDFLAPEGDRR